MARGRSKRSASKKAKTKTSKRKVTKTAKPIELYYWPTPNGFKISIMLEECGLSYVMKPVNISKGEQFNPDFLKIAPNNRMPAIIDPQGPGGRPISIFSPVRSCNIWGAKPENSIHQTSARALRSTSGCFGKWAGSVRWRARCTTSRTTR